MTAVDSVTNLSDFTKSDAVHVQPDRVELIIDRFDSWCNPSDSASASCYATYCRVDEMAA